MLRKTDREGYVKDMTTGAVLNMDEQARKAYLAKRKFAAQQISNADRINKLESEVSDIKSMLQLILEKVSNK